MSSEGDPPPIAVHDYRFSYPMVTDDVKELLQTLNGRLTQELESAVGFAVNRAHYEVTLEHLVLKLLDREDTDLVSILDHFGVGRGQVREGLLHDIEGMRKGNSGRPSFSPALLQLVESALLIGSVHHGLSEVRSGTLLEALLQRNGRRATEFLAALEPIRREELRERFFEIVEGSSESASSIGSTKRSSIEGGAPEGESALDQFTVSFTQRAREGAIDPISGRNEEIRQVTDILSRRRKNNPILVGEAGVGKTAVVEGFARRIAEGDVRDGLVDVEVHALDLGALKAGASVQGEFEDRLKSVLQDVREAPTPTVLFIDEAHTLIGAGGSEGTGDAANLLKPALARGELRAIAATTWSEYKQYIESDPALERRFQMVKIEEPSVEEAAVMLRGIKSAYEEHHGVHITDQAVKAAANLADRYVSGRQLPDKAVDLLDTTAARVKVSLTARPGRLDDLDRTLQDLNTRIEDLRRDLEAGHLEDSEELETLLEERKQLRDEREQLEARWKQEKELVESIAEKRRSLAEVPSVSGNGQATVGGTNEIGSLMEELEDVRGEQPLVHGEVNEQITAEVVSDWTGIPVGSMLEDEADMLLNLESRLQKHVLGQEPAIQEVSKTIRTSKADLASPNSPLGVFLFVGPSGVGKTETAVQLADLLFGGKRFLTTINMSEYQEQHTASQLKGSPPGYVGYGEGGVLTEAVRQRPYSVVLLDEIEKAHRDVMNIFYQVFDKGIMRDGEGREIDFRNTVLIMTSNLGAETIARRVREQEGDLDAEELREAIHPILVDHFQPALLGRMRVVPYRPLDTPTMENITEIKLDEIGERLAQAHDVDFVYESSVVDRIADRCTQLDSGARNIDFIINRTILPEAARVLIPRMAREELPDRLRLHLGEEGGFACTLE